MDIYAYFRDRRRNKPNRADKSLTQSEKYAHRPRNKPKQPTADKSRSGQLQTTGEDRRKQLQQQPNNQNRQPATDPATRTRENPTRSGGVRTQNSRRRLSL